MKKIFTIVFSAILFFSANVQAAVSEPNISASSAILIEASTGRVLYEKNSHEKRPPASMTKMLTCILGLENLSMNEEILISPTAEHTEYSGMYLKAGDTISAAELFNGVMLISDNGGAVAIGQAVAGTIPLFSDMMNKKAKEIGCKNSNFANPNGLPNENHYSTAEDMAKIAAYCMQNQKFRNIVSTKKTSITVTNPQRVIDLENTNDLLEVYDGMNGIKTGYTNAAGGCLAASAKRGNVELIAIVMHSADSHTRFDDAAKILDYGFERVKNIRNFDKDKIHRKVFVKNGTQATVMTTAKEDLKFPLLENEKAEFLSVSYDIPKIISATVKRGEVIGEAILKYNGKKVASVPLVADEQISKGFSFGSFLVGLAEPFISVAENFSISMAA